MSILFSEIKIGPHTLQHRVVAAPVTRLRAQADGSPSALMVENYAQRASAGGLMIAEATSVSLTGIAYRGAPGIYDDAHIAGWKKVVDAVHAKGGIIFLQLFHSGRMSHHDLQPGGLAPVAPSAIQADGVAHTDNGWVPTSKPRALEIDEIQTIVTEFRTGAERALAAGFDGVELHGVNGYLHDQFLQDGSNQRTDLYGGSLENRTRFLLQVLDELTSVWGSNRVAVRLGPSGTFGSMSDSNPEATFGYVVRQLDRCGLAYLHIVEPRIKGDETISETAPIASEHLHKLFKGPLIAAGGFKRTSAEAILDLGHADLVAFGRDFIANPDLPERLRHDLPLNRYDRDFFYGGNHEGYNDYPFHEELRKIA